MIYQKMLFNMGIVPSVLDGEDAEVVLEVLGAKAGVRLEYIDMV